MVSITYAVYHVRATRGLWIKSGPRHLLFFVGHLLIFLWPVPNLDRFFQNVAILLEMLALLSYFIELQ